MVDAGAGRRWRIVFVVLLLTWTAGAGSAWAQVEDQPPRYDDWPPPEDLLSDEWELEWPLMPGDPLEAKRAEWPVMPEDPLEARREPETEPEPKDIHERWPAMGRRRTNPPPEQRPRGRRRHFEGMDFDRHAHLQLALYALPVVGVAADTDELEEGEGILFDADLRTGRGLAAQLTIWPQRREHVGIGFLYLLSEHTERETDALAHLHAGFVEVVAGGALNEGPLELSLYGAAGVGGLAFDFASAFDDTGGMAGELRVQTGLRLLEALELQVGGGYILWGWYPEEAVGHVGFLNVGLALRF